MSRVAKAALAKKTKSYLPEMDVRLDNGSITHWTERAGHKVPVTCGRCELKRLVRIEKVEGKNFTGLCNTCRATKHFDDIINEVTGSKFLFSQKTKAGVPVLCGRCPADRTPRIIPDPDPKGTGYCPEHCHNHRKLIGEDRHPSGAIILWEERDPSTRAKVTFLCTNRDKQDFPNCLKKDSTWIVDVKRETWRGLCQSCLKLAGSPHKLVLDEEFPWGPFKHIIHLSRAKETRVPVTCARCGEESEVSRIRALEIRQLLREDATNWRCRKCYDDPHRMEARTQKYLEHKNEHLVPAKVVEKRRGRRTGTHGFNHTEFLTEVNQFMLELWNQHHSITAITRDAVAAKFQTKGERIGGHTIRERLKICGIAEKWPVYREFIVGEAG